MKEIRDFRSFKMVESSMFTIYEAIKTGYTDEALLLAMMK